MALLSASLLLVSTIFCRSALPCIASVMIQSPAARGREAAAETRRRAGSAEPRHRRDLARTMETLAPARTAAVEICAANMPIALDSACASSPRAVQMSQHARSQRRPSTPASSWWLASRRSWRPERPWPQQPPPRSDPQSSAASTAGDAPTQAPRWSRDKRPAAIPTPGWLGAASAQQRHRWANWSLARGPLQTDVAGRRPPVLVRRRCRGRWEPAAAAGCLLRVHSGSLLFNRPTAQQRPRTQPFRGVVGTGQRGQPCRQRRSSTPPNARKKTARLPHRLAIVT